MSSVMFCCIICNVVITYRLVKAKLGMPIYTVRADGSLFLTLPFPKQVAEIMEIDAWIQDFDFNYPCCLS